jgi:predicted transcriptional regulator
MQCEKCKINIADGEDRQLQGQILCEDCCMDLLSPAKACDPWAVFSATSFAKYQGNEPQLTPLQQEILAALRKEGPAEIGKLLARFQIDEKVLERELATLRHMEKIQGELRDGKRLIRIWDSS